LQAKNINVVLGDYNIEEENETETVIAKAKEVLLHPGRVAEFYSILSLS
jgi:hypothetical protein